MNKHWATANWTDAMMSLSVTDRSYSLKFVPSMDVNIGLK